MPARAASSCRGWPTRSRSSASCAKCRCRSTSSPSPARPTRQVWADAGVARISHGPFPHRALMAKLRKWRARRSARRGRNRHHASARAGFQHASCGTAARRGAGSARPTAPARRCATRCGHSCGCCGGAREHRHRRRQREDRGGERLAPNSGAPIAVAAKPKISTWPKVTGIDRVCTSRARRGLGADGQEERAEQQIVHREIDDRERQEAGPADRRRRAASRPRRA